LMPAPKAHRKNVRSLIHQRCLAQSAPSRVYHQLPGESFPRWVYVLRTPSRDTMHIRRCMSQFHETATPMTTGNTDETYTDETVPAMATPPGVGGIGIVRLSGAGAFAVGLRIFQPAHPLLEEASPPSHQLLYGHVIDPADDTIIDEVLAAFMRAPRTYTREDV